MTIGIGAICVLRTHFCLRSRPVDPNVVSPFVSCNVENGGIMTCDQVTSDRVTKLQSDQVME